jgi:hypothetical protein
LLFELLFSNPAAMKKLLLFIFIISFFQFTSFSQYCLPEGIIFTSQAQIDSFQVNYPGCTAVEGFVKITGADISDLNGLSMLDSVFGDLTIGDYWKGVNPNLITLEGLENLAFIGEDLVLHNNDNLVSMEALSGLTGIGKSIKILCNDDLMSLTGLEGIDSLFGVIDLQNNNELSDLTGLDSLKYLKGGLFLFTNDGLTDLEGLSNLTVVDGNVDIDNHSSLTSLMGMENLSSVKSLVIHSNDELTSLSGLESLDTISNGLNIVNNLMLSSLEGLTNLKSLTGGLSISHNEELTSLAGLEGITSIGGSLNIEWNYSLSSLDGLQNINPSSIDDLWITYNQDLSDCEIQNICGYIADPGGSINIYSNAPGCDNPHEIADNCGITLSCLPFGNYYFLTQADIDGFPSSYSNCNNLAGYIWINGENITGLDSLSGIDTINGNLFICGNTNLSSLTGLNNLKAIQSDLMIGYWEYGGNPGLTNLTGLNNLASVGDGILILGNHGLLNLTGLDSLKTIGGGFQISDNERLINLEGIENLHSAGSLDVGGNDSIINLDGLQGLINLSGNISINYNPMLAALDGMENIVADLITFLRITHNDTLTECNIQSVCDFLGIPEAYVVIEDNATGCNNQEEVEAACGVGLRESAVDGRQSAVVCFPNPALNDVVFDFNLQTQIKVNLSVFNSLGLLVATILDESLETGHHQLSWNASGFPAGIYFYRLTEGNHSSTGKLILGR